MEYNFENGMTWSEWINSKYNNDNWTINGTDVKPLGYSRGALHYNDCSKVKNSDVIIVDHIYHDEDYCL